MSAKFISTKALAERWGLDHRTLINWRSLKDGPRYLKLGRGKNCRVVYRLSEIEAYEKLKTVKTTV